MLIMNFIGDDPLRHLLDRLQPALTGKIKLFIKIG